jgi:hypothetical protein
LICAEKYGSVLPRGPRLDPQEQGRDHGPIWRAAAASARQRGPAQDADLYARLRPAKSYPGVRSRYQNIDLVIVRENHEDLYAGVEFEIGDPAIQKIGELTEAAGMGRIRADAGLSLKIISETGTRRVARFAFEYARKYGRKKVTAVAKDNILKFTDGLFFATARKLAEDYNDIEYQEMLVDNMCMQLVQKPENYDVLLLPNLYGDALGPSQGSSADSASRRALTWATRSRWSDQCTAAPQVRRAEQSQPDGAHAFRRHDAPSPRRDAGRGPDGERDRRRHRRGQKRDVRHEALAGRPDGGWDVAGGGCRDRKMGRPDPTLRHSEPGFNGARFGLDHVWHATWHRGTSRGIFHGDAKFGSEMKDPSHRQTSLMPL